MAYDVQRFNELTKQMSAYAHYTRNGHLQQAAARARRRDRAHQLAKQLNSQLRLRFRTGADCRAAGYGSPPSCWTPTTPPTRPPAKQSTGRPSGAQRLSERDNRLGAGQHPGSSDGRYRAACTYAERWDLEMPPRRSTA